ncbi:MAG: hypothetical protein IT542_04340 [Rubellimicrobium sp.]|nr:hypothetical protein [Rubellimicrobium sp.]
MSHHLPPGPHGPTRVTRLRPHLSLCLDPDTLGRLHLRDGTQATRALMAHSAEDLALRLDRIAVLYGQGACLSIPAEAEAIVTMARTVGLPELVRAAEQAGACAIGADGAALAATVARLLRLGGRALELISNLRMPGA